MAWLSHLKLPAPAASVLGSDNSKIAMLGVLRIDVTASLASSAGAEPDSLIGTMICGTKLTHFLRIHIYTRESVKHTHTQRTCFIGVGIRSNNLFRAGKATCKFAAMYFVGVYLSARQLFLSAEDSVR